MIKQLTHTSPRKYKLLYLILIISLVSLLSLLPTIKAKKMTHQTSSKVDIATFAGGCFWCMQPPYDTLPGVIDTVVGYTGGHTLNPTYKTLSSGQTGHAEAVQITFDPNRISYEELLNVFWRNIDPTTLNRQFSDYGTQYRTAIFYHNHAQKQQAEASKKELEQSKKFKSPIITTLEKFTHFYPAEPEHQDFYKNHPLRYNQYKQGSGRSNYLQTTWN